MAVTTTSNGLARAAYLDAFEKRQMAIFERIARIINPDDDPLVHACLEVTFGRGGSLNCLVGSNGIERFQLARRLASKANLQAKSAGLEMAVLVVRDKSWVFDPCASVFDLPLIRR